MRQVYATFSSKGQLVIPSAIRRELGIEPGTRMAIRIEGERMIAEPDTPASKLGRIAELRGCTAGLPSGTDLLLEDRRRERARELMEEGW